MADTGPNFGLNEDQLTLQKWTHEFAETVMRPAAEEWDEREETPWPIIEEAAKIDGATPGQAFRIVILPLAAPGLFTTAILAFIAWYVLPRVS